MTVTDLEVIALRAPIDMPVSTAFGTMYTRDTMLVRLHTDTGACGLGESWVSFPAWSLVERTATLLEGVRPLVVGADARCVPVLLDELWRSLEGIGRQWGAPGPIAQAISAVDIAAWDLLGKYEGVPVYALLGAERVSGVPLYASGIGPNDVERMSRDAIDAGFARVKLKIGFGAERDEANIASVRAAIDHAALAVDVNRGWTSAETIAMDRILRAHDVEWLEEPIDADVDDEFQTLRSAIATPIAAGENSYRARGLQRLIERGAVDIVQPDVTKTGGIREAVEALDVAARHGVPYAPHCLGGAVALIASAHVFAATPGGIALEYDVNPNPLRTDLLDTPLPIQRGHLYLGEGAGLGVELDETAVARYRVKIGGLERPPSTRLHA